MTSVDEAAAVLRPLVLAESELVERWRQALTRDDDLSHAVQVTEAEVDTWARAQEILNEFSDEQSAQLRERIERLVSHGLTSVFGEPMQFHVTTRILRGSPAVEFTLSDSHGVDLPVLGSRGGGVAQIVSFVLRVVVVRLSGVRPLLVLDEPFGMVSAEYRPRLAQFVRELADAGGVQFLIVTHDPDLPAVADARYELTRLKGTTVAARLPEES